MASGDTRRDEMPPRASGESLAAAELPPPLTRGRSLVVLAGAGLALVLSALALIGWATGRRSLASLVPHSIPMAPLTAVALAVLSGALLPLPLSGRRARVAGAAGAVTLLALAEMLAFVFRRPLVLEEWLVPVSGTFEGFPIARMSPLTDAALLVLGLAALALEIPRRRHPVRAAAAACAALAIHLWSGVVVLGYLFGAPWFYAGVIPMACGTGLALAGLSAAVAARSPREAFPLRLLGGSSARARLLRALAPVAPLIVGCQLVLRPWAAQNPALVAALTALVTAVGVGLVLALVAQGVGGDLDRALRERDDRASEAARMSRLYAALSQVDQAIVQARDRTGVFRGVCGSLVERGGFRMAWVGLRENGSTRLRPVASCGDESGYLERVEIHVDERTAGGGPSGEAFRSGAPVVHNDALAAAAALPWHAELERRGLRSSAAFPIREGGVVCGVLSVYSERVGFFREAEVALLTEAAVDLSFALDNLARQADRDRAQAIAESERLFSDTMIDSMPGILYFYDADGRFLRWNRNLEAVTGYDHEEVAAMHPLDFFAAPDQPRVAERIAEVFRAGESTVEAPLRAKDGTRTPYFFTGRRVLMGGRACLVGVGMDISERQRAEAALRESEERFHAFMDATPAIAWITDAEGRHVYMNRAWDLAFGLDHRQWLGRTAADLVAPDAAARIRETDRRVLEENRAIEVPEDQGLLRGRPFLWNCVKFPVPSRDGRQLVGGIAIDVTERKQVEAARRASEARYRSLFEQAPDGILIADRASYYLDANPSLCRMLGYARDEIVGMHARDIVVEAELPQVDAALSELHGGAAHHREWVLRRRDGSAFPAEVLAAEMPDGNLMAMIRDVSERKAAERALREINETLEQRVAERTRAMEQALAHAEAADQVKSAFLAAMSHELRTPLNSIIGFTGIVLQGLAGPLNDEQTKQLGMVRSSARHLLELINDVLDLSKIEAGQLEVRAESFDLRDSLERAVGSVLPLAEKKGLRLETRIAPEIRGMVGDRRRVEQILLNLLNNAIKFTERGAVTLSADEVEEGLAGEAGSVAPLVRLRVADTGIGIPAEGLGRLFQPFVQIDTGLTRQHEGTGLGLAICRRLATLLGGRIVAHSTPGAGSEFTVLLPRERARK